MQNRILIVARMPADASAEVAALFGESDNSELPRALGVTRRELYRYGDGLYFHQVEFAGDWRTAMSSARERDDFRRLSDDLSAFISPYDPLTWRSPADAMAQSFYRWTPEAGAESP